MENDPGVVEVVFAVAFLGMVTHLESPAVAMHKQGVESALIRCVDVHGPGAMKTLFQLSERFVPDKVETGCGLHLMGKDDYDGHICRTWSRRRVTEYILYP